MPLITVFEHLRQKLCFFRVCSMEE